MAFLCHFYREYPLDSNGKELSGSKGAEGPGLCPEKISGDISGRWAPADM